ncbi:MAG: amidophosphoribosyltransferase [Ruminococcaceae bacterium]|nr:amidophosphoribosyltransferase [Oscillospiraceae bacterium]
MFSSLHEECGVFGIFENRTASVANSVYLALYALQHRGQEACGIAVNDDGVFSHYKGSGLVPDVFSSEKLASLGRGNMALGHVRYSTTGGKDINNIQPLVIRHIKGNLALAHNGNLVNADEIRKNFELSGGIFHGTSDTEAIAYSIVSERLRSKSTEEAVEKTMQKISGAYSCVIMTATKMIAFRDPNGFRPLCIGKTEGGAYCISSESCALDAVGAGFIRDVKPGEIVVFSDKGMKSITTHCRAKDKSSICVFEYIYFARPDSVIDGASVHSARIRAGAFLAKEHPVDADIVIGVPDSGLDAALGYARESKIPYGIGFIKNRYIGRSFIQPSQEQREDAVRIKLNVMKENIEGKRVVMIDDSIVRGTTCARIVKLLREAGAKEVHMRVSAPPFRHPCHFGTDIDSSDNLIACQYDTVEEIAKVIGVDSLGYLSVEATHKIAEGASVCFCDGCFTGNYPLKVPEQISKNKFDTKLGNFSNYYQVLD